MTPPDDVSDAILSPREFREKCEDLRLYGAGDETGDRRATDKLAMSHEALRERTVSDADLEEPVEVRTVQGPGDGLTLIVGGLHVAGPEHFNEGRTVHEWTIRGTRARRLRDRLWPEREDHPRTGGPWK